MPPPPDVRRGSLLSPKHDSKLPRPMNRQATGGPTSGTAAAPCTAALPVRASAARTSTTTLPQPHAPLPSPEDDLFPEPPVEAVEAACATFAVGDRIRARWRDRPGCDDYDPAPVEWSGKVVTVWCPRQRTIIVRWDRRACPRLVGASLAAYPPWDLPADEAIFDVPTLIAPTAPRRPAPIQPTTVLPLGPSVELHNPVPQSESVAPSHEHADDDDAHPAHESDDDAPQGDPDDDPVDFEELLAAWTGAPGTYPEEALSPFRRGNGIPLPAIAALKGSDLRAFAAQPAPPMPPLVQAGLVKTTRQEHLRTLRFLGSLPPELDNVPLPLAIIVSIERAAAERKWRHATTLKKLATAQGALALLPAYRSAPPVQLTQCPLWRQAMRAAGIAARQELPKQPKPASLAQVKKVLALEPCLPTAAAIILSWVTAARTGCVLQLDRQDVCVNADQSLSVRFRRGKGARIRGPYTVHTAPLEPQMLRRLERWMAGRRAQLFASTTSGDKIRLALRRVDKALEQRSLRRGALQALARSPNITDEVLMLFSGHTQVATLRRYLSWGTAATHTRAVMAQHRAL